VSHGDGILDAILFLHSTPTKFYYFASVSTLSYDEFDLPHAKPSLRDSHGLLSVHSLVMARA
jgi:hypothetical protein